MAALGSLRLARRRGLTMLAALALLAPAAVQSYLLPGTFPTHYKRGEVLYGVCGCVWVCGCGCVGVGV